MGKIALLVVAVLVAVLWLRYKATSARSRPRPPPSRDAERMVSCGRCGVHLPAGEALIDSAGTAFCCTAHRDAGAGGR